ncbi:MAG: glycosyltransferase family 9 protein [Verrucomicrobia bacterium]|nr:glycosyltransferase family 9 protein [Verrucomicrobiota bacterium]
MPRPIVLAHTTGTSFRRAKRLSPEVTHELFATLLEQGVGTIISLDKEELIKHTNSPHVHYWQPIWGKHGLRPLIALQGLSDALIGIDSGPFHLCRLTELPSLGIFPTPGHHPAKYCLPSDHQACVVPSNDLPWFHNQANAMLPIMEEQQLNAPTIAKHLLRLLSEPRYLLQNQRGWDLQIQHWLEKTSKPMVTQKTDASDSDHSSYDILLRIVRKRFHTPHFVETNSFLEEHLCKNLTFKNLILARVSQASGGFLTSIADKPNRVSLECLPHGIYGKSVQLIEGRPFKLLTQINRSIDVLSLGRACSNLQQAQQQCLLEARAAIPKLSRNSLILIHDKINSNDNTQNWSSLAIDRLCKREWHIIHSGHPILLSRTDHQ